MIDAMNVVQSCRVFVRSFHSDHFTLSLCLVSLAWFALRHLIRRCYERPIELSIWNAEMTVSN